MILSPLENVHRFGGKPRITQVFGARPEVYKRFGTDGHSGIDFRCRVGTKVYAPFDGIVTVEKKEVGYGYNIRLKSDRLECVLAHLSAFLVEDGKQVSMGDEIGLTGGAKGSEGAGFSTGPHLHFGIRHISPDGKPMYPQNGFNGFEDLTAYTITWHGKLKT